MAKRGQKSDSHSIERGVKEMAEQKNMWPWALAVLTLLLGALFTYAVFPRVVEKEVPGPTVKVEVPVPGPERIVYVNQTVEVPASSEVSDISSFLATAVADTWDEYKRDDKFLTCGKYTYDKEDVDFSLDRVTDWSYEWLDDDKYAVHFAIKQKFDDNTDEHACKTDRKFSVTYEDDENPVVDWS